MEFTGERCIIGESGSALEKEHIDRYKFALKYVRDKTVLDIACGSGYGTHMLSKIAKKVYGADISKESIIYAKINYKNNNTEYYVADATNIRFLKDDSVDVITSFETIEHIQKYKIFLKEIKRVLKKEGIAIISTPNKKYSSPNSKKPINPYHFKEFYAKDIQKDLSNIFTKVEFYGQNYQTAMYRCKVQIYNLLPKKFLNWKIFNNIAQKQKLDSIKEITNKNPEKCKYLVVICIK